MKKIISVFALVILGFSQILYGADYKKLLTGQWRLLKINNGGRNITISTEGFAFWEIHGDGTGSIDMRYGERQKKIFFIWHILNNQIMTEDRDTKKKDSFSFGFYDDFLVLIKAPDNTMLLQKIK